MKRDALFGALSGAILAGLLSFGTAGCIATAFSFDVSLGSLAIFCIAVSAVSAAALLLSFGTFAMLCLGALAGGYLWRSGALVGGISALIYDISGYYGSAYGWTRVGSPFGDAAVALYILGAIVAFFTAWTICRSRPAILAVTLSLLPTASCFVVTDTVPSGGCIFALLLGLLILMLTNGLRRVSPTQANTLTAIVALPTAVALGLMFLLIPQDSYVNRSDAYRETLLDWLESVPQKMEDMSDTFLSGLESTVQPQSVDLRNQGPRTLYTYPVMDVIAARSETLYLRERDYDSYTGTGWTSTPGRVEVFSADASEIFLNAGVVTISTRRSRETRFYPYYPSGGVTLRGGSTDNDDGSALYEIRQCVLPDNWRALTQPLSEKVDARYLELPEQTRIWAERTVRKIISDDMSATQKADAIAAFVRNSAAYDLQTDKMAASETDFAEWFIEKSDTGYCVHFATATSVLLRAAGVASRYVTGYMVDGVAGQKVTVTADRAHAWAEYFEPSLGIWIALESTPSSASGETQDESTATQSTQTPSDPSETNAPTDSGESVSNIGGAEMSLPSERDGTISRDDAEPISKTEHSEWLAQFAAVLLRVAAIAAMLGAVAAQRAVRIALRRRAVTKGAPNRRALALWRVCTQYAGALKESVPPPLEALAEKAKYSRHTLTVQELSEFERYLRSAKSRCRHSAWYRRLVYRWIFALY